MGFQDYKRSRILLLSFLLKTSRHNHKVLKKPRGIHYHVPSNQWFTGQFYVCYQNSANVQSLTMSNADAFVIVKEDCYVILQTSIKCLCFYFTTFIWCIYIAYYCNIILVIFYGLSIELDGYHLFIIILSRTLSILIQPRTKIVKCISKLLLYELWRVEKC